VDPVEENRKLVARFGFPFPVLSDAERTAVRAFDVLHPGAHPSDATDIARPATFIVSGGRVRWRDLTPNYRIRPRPEALLEVLRSLEARRR